MEPNPDGDFGDVPEPAAARDGGSTENSYSTNPTIEYSNDRALIFAVRYGMLERVDDLLRKRATNVNARHPEEQKTPLLLAASLDNTAMVRKLLDFEANIRDTCPQGMTVSLLVKNYRFVLFVPLTAGNLF